MLRNAQDGQFGDEPNWIAFYCPACAERESGSVSESD
jgi:hypothetical protein